MEILTEIADRMVRLPAEDQEEAEEILLLMCMELTDTSALTQAM